MLSPTLIYHSLAELSSDRIRFKCFLKQWKDKREVVESHSSTNDRFTGISFESISETVSNSSENEISSVFIFIILKYELFAKLSFIR